MFFCSGSGKKHQPLLLVKKFLKFEFGLGSALFRGQAPQLGRFGHVFILKNFAKLNQKNRAPPLGRFGRVFINPFTKIIGIA
jgi:hypothetical protein